MSVTHIILLVAIIDAAIWIPFIILVKRRSAAFTGLMSQTAVLEGESLIMGPGSAIYRGGTKGRGWLKGNCIVGLTNRKIMYSLLFGSPGEIQLADIESVSESKWFLKSYRNGRMHMILHLRDGSQVGFILKNHDAWMSAIQSAISRRIDN